MRLANVKGIVWDLDGTILDSFNIFQAVISEVVIESGYKMPSPAEIAKNYHGSLEETIKTLLGIKSTEELNELVLSFIEKQSKYYENDLESHFFSDAINLAQSAAKKGLHQIIITNRDHAGRNAASPRFIVATTVLSECINEVRPGDEVEIRKPDPSSLGDWDIRHDLKPEEILVIGDQFVDAKLAINLGSRGILVDRNKDIVDHDLEGLLPNDSLSVVTSLNDIELV